MTQRATSGSPKKTSASPTKSKQPDSPGPRALQKEWNLSLKPWVKDPKFVHPKGTKTVSKTDAKKTFKLNDKEMATLPYESRPSDKYLPMQLYNYNHLMELAKRKCSKLAARPRLASTVSIAALPAWMEHMSNAQPPPLKLSDYSTPPNAVTPDPEKIIWTPSKISGPVTVNDACRLYCTDSSTQITPADIRDLANHSPWIDLATVAKRAVALHGGFYAHKQLYALRLPNPGEADQLLASVNAGMRRRRC
ncbi:hypothetical protein DFH07DRAFT_767772 [Mycena maculata]|uniref:Uncharacterized protein n=1 Tax=Mycena maculata TaxID=230809 RepID=A0AAD7NRT2_9AGAR|nr:hypothetical protein DFH07DRAFT_767772 [Mycena maculata]